MTADAVILRPRPPRSPWQLFYGAAHRLRQRWYAHRAARLPRPVVSVGNLHWGGSGKTPLTAAIAAHLRDRGLRVAVLSRGYRSRGRGVRVVSSGEGPLLGPMLAGDEPVLLAGELPGVGVVVGADRYRAGLQALERLSPPPGIFVLDDGFSHLKLHRDLDVLAFPADDPFAGGRLPPGGRLREPLASARRAHAAVLTDAEDDDAGGLAQALRPFGFRGRAFASRTITAEPLTEHGEALPAGTPALLVVGIARPQRVLTRVAGLSVKVTDTLVFGDHHGYPPASIARIDDARRRSGAEVVLTTPKDQVKLLGRLEAPLAVIPVRAEPQPAFWQWLDARLDELGPAGDPA